MKYLFSIISFCFLNSISKAQFYTAQGTSVFIGNGAMITVAKGDVTLNNAVAGNGTGKLVLNGNQLQNLTNNGYSIFGLEINNVANVLISHNLYVKGILTLTNGALKVNDKVLTLGENVICTNGTISGSELSELIITGLNGGSLGTINFTPTENVFKNVSINRIGGNATIGNQLKVNNVLTISNGLLNTGNRLTLLSNATNTARVAPVNGIINGQVLVERYIPGKRAWRFLTAPLNSNLLDDVTLSNSWQLSTSIVGPTGVGLDFVKPNYSFMQYKNNNWEGITNTTNETLFTNNLSASTKAYAAFITGDRSVANNTAPNFNNTTLSAVGNLLTGTQLYTFNALKTGDYVLIGNPYASPIDLNAVYLNSTTTNISRSFYTWDPHLSSANNTGGYITINWDGISGYDIVPPTTAQTQLIQSGQAFFVEILNNAPTKITFEESNKFASTTNEVFGVASNTVDKLFINLQKNNGTATVTIDGVLATYGKTFSSTVLPNEDINKLNNNEEGISIKRNNKDFSIERRPLVVTTNDTIFLNINKLIPNTNYTLNLLPKNWDAGLTAVLIDKLLSTETPINLQTTQENILINSAIANSNNRWMIVLKPTNILPSFNLQLFAELKENFVLLNWAVENETSVNEFEVQKSIDGKIFETFNKLKANGTLAYKSSDKNPTQNFNYYRVKTIFNNNNFIYSNITTLNFNSQSLTNVEVFPNPINGSTINLQLNNLPKGNYRAKLINVIGQEIQNFKIKHIGGSSTNSLLVTKIAKGNYQLIVVGENIIETIKLLVQ